MKQLDIDASPPADILNHHLTLTLMTDIISYYARMSVIQDLFIGQDQLTSHKAVGRVGCEFVEPDK